MKKSYRFLPFVLLALLNCGCNSIKQPETVFEPLNYSEQNVVDAEKKRILEMQEKTPVQALWRSYILNDAKTLSDCEDYVFEKFEQAVASGDYYNAVKYYKSLKSCGYEKLSQVNISENLINSEYLKDVPGLAAEKSMLPKTMTDCLNATVTVWVDKGIKIEHGAGFADRIIGSGFFIDKRGYIVTNHHVISDMVDPKNEKYSRLYIKLPKDSETRIPAKVVGYDSLLDIALLKVEITPPFILELGSSKDLELGDSVSVIGTPVGLQGTVTSGIVSSIDRKLFTMGNVFQIDAAVNSGNSGGPCIDASKKVQAIVFAGILQYQGLNFAIPVEYLRQDLPFLYHGGKRRHSWTGSYGHTMKNGYEDAGLEVQYVMPGGIASRSGIEKHDLITFADEKRIYKIEEMQTILRGYEPETIIPIQYIRGDETLRTLVYLDERPEQPGYDIYNSDLLCYTFIPLFGMELVPSSTISKRTYSICDIIKGSMADESGFSITDPVHVSSVSFSDKNDAIAVAINTRRKKRGYLDIAMNLMAALDNPYYF